MSQKIASLPIIAFINTVMNLCIVVFLKSILFSFQLHKSMAFCFFMHSFCSTRLQESSRQYSQARRNEHLLSF